MIKHRIDSFKMSLRRTSLVIRNVVFLNILDQLFNLPQPLCVVGVVQKKEIALAGLRHTFMSLSCVVNLNTTAYLIKAKCEKETAMDSSLAFKFWFRWH